MIRSALTCLCLVIAALTAQAQTIAITGGKVVTNTDNGIIEDATVIITNGKITSVGTGTAPDGATIVDATGQWVTPGLFAPFSTVGLVEIGAEDATNDTRAGGSALQISLQAADEFNPDATAVDVTRIEGITRVALALTASSGMLGGYGAIADTSGDFNSVSKDKAFLYAALGERGASLSGGSRAAAWAWLEAAFDDARHPLRYANHGEGDVLSRREAARLAPVLNGEIPLMISVHRASDLLKVIELKQEEPDLDIILIGAEEGWRVADELAASGIPVIINPMENLPASFEMLGATMENAARLGEAGVTIAFPDPGEASHNSRLIAQLAGIAVANGLDWDTAFAAISSTPAMIYGRKDLGTLSNGATADVVIWDGDPLELMSSPVAVYIDGQPQDMTSRQTRLRDRYLNVSDMPDDERVAYK